MRKKHFLMAMCFIFIFCFSSCKSETANIDTPSDVAAEGEVEEQPRIIMINDKLYYDAGRESDANYRCGVMDGEIASSVEPDEIPTENGQSNFGSGYSFQFGMENSIEVLIEDKWIVFELKNKE